MAPVFDLIGIIKLDYLEKNKFGLRREYNVSRRGCIEYGINLNVLTQ